MRRDRSASRMWFGCARFSTVLLNNTSNSSCSRLNSPVNGCSPVLITIPSRTHCQNCACVVQNCLRSRQTTSAVFFLRFFFRGAPGGVAFTLVVIEYTSVLAWRFRLLRALKKRPHTYPVGKPLLRGSSELSNCGSRL